MKRGEESGSLTESSTCSSCAIMPYKAAYNVNISQHANFKLTIMHVNTYSVLYTSHYRRTTCTLINTTPHHILTNCCYPQTSRSSQQAQELLSLAINHRAELIIPSVCMAGLGHRPPTEFSDHGRREEQNSLPAKGTWLANNTQALRNCY